MAAKKSSSKQKIEAAMAEVHTNVPSTVKATGKTGAEHQPRGRQHGPYAPEGDR